MIESKRGNKQALFLFEPRSFVPLATVQDEKTYWYQCDQVGAPQELTDLEGNIVWAADYKVWGETTLRKTGTDGIVRYPRNPEPPPVLEQPFRFQGQQFDEETGLHYNRYRYYDPGVGRFVSQDPIGLLGGSNLFAYAPNPLGWVDPFGLNEKCPSCETDFIVTKDGTAVHSDQSKLKQSITDAGATSKGPSTNTTETGEIFHMDTENGPMEIRVMEGRANGGIHQDARTVITRPGTKEYIHADGSRIQGAVSKADRRAIGHIHGQRP
jgi:RHS repeat-associated protein